MKIMITQELLTYPVIPKEYLFPSSIEEFLDMFEGILDLDIEKGMELNFFIEGHNNDKISPILRLARPKDAKEITNICKEVYKKSYPYKQIEDPSHVKKMIKSPNHHFILFIVDDYIAGCFRCEIDFEHKKAYMGTFILREQFHRNLDVVKTIMGAYYWMWSTFNDEVIVWYCENRTAHATSQYITAVCGINTIAILPNKDVFFQEVESDVMGIMYRQDSLTKHRSEKVPSLIEGSVDCFLYADNLYQLGFFQLVSPHLNMNEQLINSLRKNIKRKITRDKHGYQHFCLKFDDRDSYFTFLHTLSIQNFEKVKYKVSCIEELFVFLEEIQKCIKEYEIRYCEIFISSYEPQYQKLLQEFGFQARGYAPCILYNELNGKYDDQVIFNWYQGEIEKIELLPQGKELYDMLGL
jgi:hypothetical protein